MKIGIFGGTFDPIHLGHTAILKAAARSGYLDKIIVIPNAFPPHKSIEQISMASYRYEMTRIALDNLDFEIPVELSDIELFRKGKSYTIDTIEELKKTLSSSDEIVLIYGSDVVFDIENWYQPRMIMKECELFIAIRPGFEGDEFDKKTRYLIDHYSAKIALFSADYIDISSTLLRENLISEHGESCEDKKTQVYLLPAVQAWINKNKIYKNQNDLTLISHEIFLSLQDYECELQKIITKDRLIHSINTMREAVKLAALFGGDINKSAIAGLLHDCAKSKIVNTGKQFQTNERNDPYLSDPLISPDILHAYLGKKMAIEKFHIEDKDILNSIYYHTTSRKNSSLLEKIIFVADKIEPARTFLRIDEIRNIAYNSLDDGLFNCLADIIALLHRNNKVPHPDTIAAYESIMNKKC